MSERADLIYDIYTNQEPIKNFRPFSDLRKEQDERLRVRDYHSQVVLELYLLLEVIDLSPETFTSRALIECFFLNSLVSQRKAELCLISFQLSTSQIGIKMTDEEALFAGQFIMSDTLLYLRKLVPTDQLPRYEVGRALVTRHSSNYQKAVRCHEVIVALSEILGSRCFTMDGDMKTLWVVVKRLALCNQNLNRLIVVK